MKFFTEEDFPTEVLRCGQWAQKLNPEIAARFANDKLEREGQIVYKHYNAKGDKDSFWCINNKLPGLECTGKALLISVEPIEKCSHPKEKVQILITEGWQKQNGEKLPVFQSESYQCECGTKVQPSFFEEIK